MDDIRWIQRFHNFQNALKTLEEGIELSHKRELSKLEKQGIIQGFEFTHELSWKVLKDFLEDRGNLDIYGSKDAVRESFQLGIIDNGDIWMGMIKDRNLSSHTYDEAQADAIVQRIITSYFSLFLSLESTLRKYLP
jgi:nucleotidyltransferase substrate binding protein (TIGR01987 family)